MDMNTTIKELLKDGHKGDGSFKDVLDEEVRKLYPYIVDNGVEGIAKLFISIGYQGMKSNGSVLKAILEDSFTKNYIKYTMTQGLLAVTADHIDINVLPDNEYISEDFPLVITLSTMLDTDNQYVVFPRELVWDNHVLIRFDFNNMIKEYNLTCDHGHNFDLYRMDDGNIGCRSCSQIWEKPKEPDISYARKPEEDKKGAFQIALDLKYQKLFPFLIDDAIKNLADLLLGINYRKCAIEFGTPHIMEFIENFLKSKSIQCYSYGCGIPLGHFRHFEIFSLPGNKYISEKHPLVITLFRWLSKEGKTVITPNGIYWDKFPLIQFAFDIPSINSEELKDICKHQDTHGFNELRLQDDGSVKCNNCGRVWTKKK